MTNCIGQHLYFIYHLHMAFIRLVPTNGILRHLQISTKLKPLEDVFQIYNVLMSLILKEYLVFRLIGILC